MKIENVLDFIAAVMILIAGIPSSNIAIIPLFFFASCLFTKCLYGLSIDEFLIEIKKELRGDINE